MVKVCYDKDVKTNYLKDRTVAVIGYGSQGRAQSLNLRDSGINVILGLEEEWKKLDPSYKLAEDEGFKIYSVADATKKMASKGSYLFHYLARAFVFHLKTQPASYL